MNRPDLAFPGHNKGVAGASQNRALSRNGNPAKIVNDDPEKDESTELQFVDQLIFDSVHVNFHIAVFIEQFVAHMILPLAFLIINPFNQGFISKDGYQIFANIVTPLLLYFAIASYFVAPASDRQALDGAVWMTLLMYSVHKLTVALKYASLSRTEYAKFQTTKSPVKAKLFSRQMQLLSGWSARDKAIIDFELGCAAARIGAKINEMFFAIEDANTFDGGDSAVQLAHWNAALIGEKLVTEDIEEAKVSPKLVRQEEADGSRYFLSVFDLCQLLVHSSESRRSIRESVQWIVVNLLVLASEMVPLLHILRARDLGSRSAWLYAFLVCSCTLNYFYGTAALNILVVGLWDTLRQHRILRRLHKMIRLSELPPVRQVTYNKSSKEFSMKHKAAVELNMQRIMSVTFTQNLSPSTKLQQQQQQQQGWVASDVKPFSSLQLPSPELSSEDPNVGLSLNGVAFLDEETPVKEMGSTYCKQSAHSTSIYITDQLEQQPQCSNEDCHGTNNCSLDVEGKEEEECEHMLQLRRDELNENEQCVDNGGDTSDINNGGNSCEINVSETASDIGDSKHRKPSLMHQSSSASSAALVDFSQFGNDLAAAEEQRERAQWPRLSMRTARNVISWTYTRLLFQHFGDRFRVRTDTYIGATALLMVAFMAWALIRMIVAPDPVAVVRSPMFIQSLIQVTIVWIFMISLSTVGAMINEELSIQSRTISAHVLRLREEIFVAETRSQQNAQELADLKKALTILESCTEVLDHFADRKPFKILGFKIYSSNVATIVSTGLSFYGVIFSLYTAALSRSL